MFKFKLKDEKIYNFLRTVFSDEEIQRTIFDEFKTRSIKACFEVSQDVFLACEFESIDIEYVEEPSKDETRWLPYPAYKPTELKRYLVTTTWGEVISTEWNGGRWRVLDDPQVVAFAERPAPYVIPEEEGNG